MVILWGSLAKGIGRERGEGPFPSFKECLPPRSSYSAMRRRSQPQRIEVGISLTYNYINEYTS